MNIKDLRDIIDNNIGLIGKKIGHGGIEYSVIDILIAPKGDELDLFLNVYKKSGRDPETIKSFLPNENLDVFLICQKANGEERVISFNEVKLYL